MSEKTYEVPVWKKYALTIDEAAVYFHIGHVKLRSMVDEDPNAEYVIHNGTKVLIKRVKFEEYLDACTTV